MTTRAQAEQLVAWVEKFTKLDFLAVEEERWLEIRDHFEAALRDVACPREHAGIERLMMNIMGNKPVLPDPELGQDVAAIAFAHERQLVDAKRATWEAAAQEVGNFGAPKLAAFFTAKAREHKE